MLNLNENPFSVKTPEDISAEDAKSLFVDAFTDFPKVRHVGHTFLNGHRGSGKSMMFRYLQPDCQLLVTGDELNKLPFYSVYIPIKKTDLKLTDLDQLVDQHANVLINEHFMCIYVATKVFASLANLEVLAEPDFSMPTRAFLLGDFQILLKQCGWEGSISLPPEGASAQQYLQIADDLCNQIFADVLLYLKKLFTSRVLVYNGPLCGYLDFLYPLLKRLKALPFMPKSPIFLLFDDADNLSRVQTMILNSWVATRTSDDASLKISTQLRYKTYRTITGQTIETPHDYQEVNISSIYTSSRSKYLQRVKDIVQKRLELAKIDVSPESFFPPDTDQEEKISVIAENIRNEWDKDGRGYRPADDVTRYSRPTFIQQLKGSSKSGSTYSYAGFEQLAHISSGLIRYFLEPASLMFDQEKALRPGEQITSISPSIQTKVVREQAEYLIYSEFEKILEDKDNSSAKSDIQKLGNLINALGGTFGLILTSNRSERRVFSFAFSDTPDEEILNVLKLGVDYGYFHESSIGNKDGTGRTRLYVLTRRLAPHFTLDPAGFAGYLFVTAKSVREAMNNPSRMLRSMKSLGFDKFMEDYQLSLFE